MRVIVAGASGWDNREAIRRELSKLPPDTTVVHGDAPGADAIAGEVATELGLCVEPMAKNKDDYARYKRGAWRGLNERMLATGASLILAFHHDLASSRGTKHLVALAHKGNVAVRVFTD